MNHAPPETAADPEEPAAEADWLSRGERGTLLAMQAGFAAARLLGRRGMWPLVNAIALWYLLTDRNAVAASRTWLETVRGRPATRREVFRHLRTFVRVTADRVFLLTGRTSDLAFTRTGAQHLEELKASGRGAILLGAHLGSYEAMRAAGVADGMAIHVLGYFENSRKINALFERLDPEGATRVLHLGRDPVGVMASVQERLADGDLVALLGDRVGLNDRTVTARFLGRPAPFPAGPFLMASALKCPVYLVFGLYRGPNHYDLHCEPFAERIEISRADRQQGLRRWAQAYADRLEHHARVAPENWFNFFDFWNPMT